jgi:hypothetical protein
MTYQIKHLEIVDVPETKSKRRQWLSAAGVLSILSALISIVTVSLSYMTLQQQVADKKREVLNQALSLATDKAGGADRRIAGIWGLKMNMRALLPALLPLSWPWMVTTRDLLGVLQPRL